MAKKKIGFKWISWKKHGNKKAAEGHAANLRKRGLDAKVTGFTVFTRKKKKI